MTTSPLSELLADPSLIATQAYLAGDWVDGAGGQFEVTNPATGEVLAMVADVTREQTAEAVEKGRLAQKEWAARTAKDRSNVMRAWFNLIMENQEDLAKIMTAEQGKPLAEARGEISYGASFIEFYAEEAKRILGEIIPGHQPDKRIHVLKQPIGVVGSITPWNFPVMIAVWHILPALRTGNTVVVKPSPFTPLATIRLVEIMQSVLPENVVQVVTGDDKEVNLGAAMSAHEGIRKIVFTGSCATGRRVMQTAAETMKRLTLELGGNDAGIVLPDADPAAIAEGLFWGAFINNGQTCAAMKRLYVHDSIYDEVCENLVAYAKNIPVGDGPCVAWGQGRWLGASDLDPDR